MQAVLESDEDLLAEVLRLGVQSLMEAESARRSGMAFKLASSAPESGCWI
jgi:hypothetical protein